MCHDEKIGTVKVFLGQIDEIPQGWVLMNGVANASYSGLNMLDPNTGELFIERIA